MKTPEDYWETICTAIIVGGDVDTTAAMAGAISGAYLGLDAIPRELAVNLNDQGTWKFTELVQLAEQCYGVQCKQT
ncbi:ADP-ribosylglycohydrolase family protein [Oscillatoria sp. HE19RPO]|uniref:ADP-ribosylglycohydrolase family protein n=1 Tax=Oscillatoria sp. HE19RPO TaxID=2954806 RepID=UPI0020C54018|nr:ADP-ribosylglycohydrolase family protein [Oscillatoria sp. HE19RPO]